MATEVYPCYIRIGDEKDDEESVEVPTEMDGAILLSTIQAIYPDAIGLKFKGESGAWRGVRLSENVCNPPLEGWGNNEYFIAHQKTGAKRKFDDDPGDGGLKTKKISDEEMLSDLIVMGLPYAATEEDMENYFEQFGELEMYQIKMDATTNKSRGFGFIRYKTVEAVEAVLAASHTIMGRKCQVSFPAKGRQNTVATKLFVGRLPEGTTMEDLRTYFSEYGALTDVYIPAQFRGFGFVTFASPAVTREVLSKQHIIKGSSINLSFPTPKGEKKSYFQNSMGMQQQQQHPQYGYGNMQGNMMQGNMMQGNMMQGNMQGNMQGPPGPGYNGYGNQFNNMNSYYGGGGMSGGKVL